MTKKRSGDGDRPLRILCSNDDGIRAPGLDALEKIANALSDDVWIVAPETEQSGASHSLTLHAPLRLREMGPRKFAVQGTPTDSVMMAIRHVMKDHPPDLVLSGVNRGANIADDVTYSGTIAAAMEGTVLGVPSIALSQAYGFNKGTRVKWACAEHHAPALIKRLLDGGWPRNVLINMNFPDALPESVEGVDVTVQGRRDENLASIEAREDLRGNFYYWIGFKRVLSHPDSGTDLHSIYNGRISITPLHLDLTERSVLADLNRRFGAVAKPKAKMPGRRR
jgi:5'-nucleotidase